MTYDNNGSAATADEPGQSLVARKPMMLRPIAEPAQMIEAQNEMRALIRGALKEGTEPGTGDYGIAPGTDKKALWKPGAEKIALGMGCMFGNPRIVEREVDHDRVNRYVKRKKKFEAGAFKGWEEVAGESYGLYRFVIAVAVINRATGEIVGEGIGACSSMESKYIDRPRDCENTVIKMAQKRAMVHATLIAFGLSGEFSSGEDDEEGDAPTGDAAAPGAAPAPAPAKEKAKAATGETKCPKCKGAMWDNRPKKESGEFKPNAPDFSCKDKGCGGKVWPKKEEAPRADVEEEMLPWE